MSKNIHIGGNFRLGPGISLLAFFTLLIVAVSPYAMAAATDTHTWQRIQYPPVPVPGIEREGLYLMVGSGSFDGKPQLRFDVMWNTGNTTPLPKEIADPKNFTVRLHLPDGTVVQPYTPYPPSWVGAGTIGMTYSLVYRFPWQQNALDEAWIEFAIPGQTYWVALPYGFTRDPAAALPSGSKNGKPAFASAMKALGETDRLVPWLFAEYMLGQTSNGLHLVLWVANSFDTKAEVTLYRQPGNPDSRTDGPKISAEIREAGGRVVAASPSGTDDDKMRRIEKFSFERNPGDAREWGSFVIKVDDQAYECVIPSSLFRSGHGLTAPDDKRWLPRPPNMFH